MCRAKQAQIALALDRLPQFALHQRRFEDPGQLRHAAAIGGEIQPAAGVAVNLHGLHRFHARRIEMAPDAHGIEKACVGRADRVDARIPSLRENGRLAFDQCHRQTRAAQSRRQGQSGQATPHDHDIEVHTPIVA